MNLVLQPILGTIFIILLFIKYQYRSQYNIENVSFRQYFQEFPEIKEVNHELQLSKKEYSDAFRNTTLLQHVFYTPPSFVLRKDYYVPSYYQLRLGVLYDHYNTSQPFNNSIQLPFNIGSSYSILTSCIHDETETRPSEYTSVQSWNEKFERVQNEVYKAYKLNNKQVDESEEQSDYSIIHVWRNRYSNSRVIYAKNVCFVPYSGKILLYFPVNTTLDRSLLRGGFQWGWSIQEFQKKYPFHDQDITKGTVVTFPPFRNHIYHALEGVGLLLHKLFSAEELPYMTEVINSGVSEQDVAWIKEMLELLTNSIPLDETMYTLDRVRQHPAYKNEYLCFRTVTFLDRMKQGGHGGFLPGFIGTDWIRSLVYKRYGLQPRPFNSTSYQLLFVQRSHTRKWVNATAIIHSIQERWKARIQIVDFELSSSSLSSQVRVFYQAHLLLTPHGAGMTNAIFMLPHTVVLEVTPPHFTDFCLSTVLHHARLHYIYIPNYDYRPLTRLNITYPDQAYLQNVYAGVRSRYKNLDLETNLFQLHVGLEDAIAYLDHYRTRQVNDYLSPIFV